MARRNQGVKDALSKNGTDLWSFAKMIKLPQQPCAPLAQLDRASDYESEGREFESLRARHEHFSRVISPAGRIQEIVTQGCFSLELPDAPRERTHSWDASFLSIILDLANLLIIHIDHRRQKTT